ncbi:MAG: prephenate dehydrogenase/arogenate dehydrogenase family protein [Cyanobacteriota bacterium]
MLPKNNLKIGIIGLGLIGGSLAKVLIQKGYSVTGIAHSDSTFNKAERLNIFSKVSRSTEDLNGCDIIFVATPINTINITFQKLNSSINRPCIITDVASIKGEILDLARKIFINDQISFIAGHPMAGTEYKGIDNSFAELFQGARWVLCPDNPNKNKQVCILSDIIEDTGALVTYANPYTHDMAVALISHMPLLVSMGLIESVSSQEDIILKELALYLAASGYRDTTRIAGGNPELSYDMLKYNQKNVLKAINLFETNLNNLKNILNKTPEETLEKFEEISKLRQSIYSESGKNIFKGLSG